MIVWCSKHSGKESEFKGAISTVKFVRTIILRGNIADLAVGIVISAAFIAMVTFLVRDIIARLTD